jgi:hypothetical protein
MTLLAVVRDVCATVGVMMPQTVFGSINTNRTMQEMVSLANEMAQRIAYDTRDWTALRRVGTFTGDGQFLPPRPDPLAVWTGTVAFVLPADYRRMLLTTNVWRSTDTQSPMIFISDADDWLQRRISYASDYGGGEWTIIGDQMHIWPIMAGPVVDPPFPAVTATFTYLDRNCVALTGGGYGDSFMADTDRFRLDERLLKLGMIWQWKAQKGSPYAEDMGTYSDALANVTGHDQPAPIIIGRSPRSQYDRVSGSWPPGWGPP